MRRAAWPPTGRLSLKGRQMRKFHVAGSAVAALSLVLTASAFASPATVTARPAATPVTVSDPGQPMVPAWP
jgi:hypothetical protein